MSKLSETIETQSSSLLKNFYKKIAIKFLVEASEARKNQRIYESWKLLQIAHIGSQPWALLHFCVHFEMLKLALATKNAQEIFGQIVRLVLAIPATVLGKYPVGNPGTSDVSMFKTCDLPEVFRKT
jgi:hypothetical protein